MSTLNEQVYRTLKKDRTDERNPDSLITNSDYVTFSAPFGIECSPIKADSSAHIASPFSHLCLATYNLMLLSL